MTKYSIDLKQTPNQEFFINLEHRDMTIRLIDREIPLFSLSMNDEFLVQNVPCFANQGILPYPYMTAELGGNFIFETENDEYPCWRNFGTTCNFFFDTSIV